MSDGVNTVLVENLGDALFNSDMMQKDFGNAFGGNCYNCSSRTGEIAELPSIVFKLSTLSVQLSAQLPCVEPLTKNKHGNTGSRSN
jgi:hypothetical protein